MVRKKAEGTDGFVRRLNQACDDVPHIIPAHGEGRQIELAKRMDMSQEGVRKWFAGEAMPRRAAMHKLAKILEVEEPWLALGISPELTREERDIRARSTDGAVLTVMGLMMISGAACATPGDSDPKKGFVDFYAILHGVQMAMHVSLARNTQPGVYDLTLPREYREVRTIGVIPLGNNRYDFIKLDGIDTPKYLQRKGGGYVLSISKGQEGTYTRGDMVWKRIKHFGELA